MTNKELIEAFRAQTKYASFCKFLDNFEIPVEEEEIEDDRQDDD
jgi:hypothetical protein